MQEGVKLFRLELVRILTEVKRLELTHLKTGEMKRLYLVPMGKLISQRKTEDKIYLVLTRKLIFYNQMMNSMSRV